MTDRLRDAVDRSTLDERRALCCILGCPEVLASRPTLVHERLEIFMGKHFAGGAAEATYPYGSVCRRVARALGVDASQSDLETELRIVEYFARRFDAAMTNQQAASVRDVVSVHSGDAGAEVRRLIALGGFLALVRAGGFDAYASASTLLSAGASVFGVTVPFSGYLALSSGIAHVIGPAAWAAIGVKAFQSLRKANDVRLAPIVLWVFIVQTRIASAVQEK